MSRPDWKLREKIDMREKPIGIAVLVSGKGTNLQALIDVISRGEIKAKILSVISSREGIPALEKAAKANLPFYVLNPVDFKSREAYDEALARKLLDQNVELVVLAGFMRILSSEFLRCFPKRVLNLHPALLPDDPKQDEILLPDGLLSKVFRGHDVVKQALDAGVRWTGCTVHLVTEDLDRGPVIRKQAIPILPGDTQETLHARIQEAEHKILPLAVEEWGKRLERFRKS